MSQFFTYLAAALLALVAVVLLLGLMNMVRGGSSNRSQILMRYRVLLQALAVAAIVVALVYAAG